MVFGYFLAIPAFAQDSAADDYSDYSYLWESTKKKKKNKKSKEKPQPEVVAVPADSIQSVSEEVTVPTDSIDNVSENADTYTPPLDSIPEEVVEETPEPKKEKKVRPEQPPVEDFRAGMASSGGSFTGGFTYTRIGDQSYVGMVLSPEFSIKKVGVGLNVPILYGLDDKSIRTEIFKDGVGPLRLIRYVRYGVQKKDPVYVKVVN